jgi:uncharacterized membrane protein
MSGGPAAITGQAGAGGHRLSPFARFVIYGLVGWCIECLFTSVVDLASGTGDLRLKGYSYLWMHPIWGAGLLLGERLLMELQRRRLSRAWRVFLGMWVCFAVEYLTGAVLVAVIGRCPWDYSGSVASVHGLIRLDYAPFWLLCAWMCEPLFSIVRRVRIGTSEPEPEVEPGPAHELRLPAGASASLYR